MGSATQGDRLAVTWLPSPCDLQQVNILPVPVSSSKNGGEYLSQRVPVRLKRYVEPARYLGHSRPLVNSGPLTLLGAGGRSPLHPGDSTEGAGRAGQEGPGSMAGRRSSASSFNLLPHHPPLRVQKLQLRPPRTWKPELEEPVISALRSWISQTPGQWRLQPFSMPSWRSCRARVRECSLDLSASHCCARQPHHFLLPSTCHPPLPFVPRACLLSSATPLPAFRIAPL